MLCSRLNWGFFEAGLVRAQEVVDLRVAVEAAVRGTMDAGGSIVDLGYERQLIALPKLAVVIY